VTTFYETVNNKLLKIFVVEFFLGFIDHGGGKAKNYG